MSKTALFPFLFGLHFGDSHVSASASRVPRGRYPQGTGQGHSLKDIKNILAEVGSPVFVVKMQKQYSFWGLNLLAMFDKNSPQAY